MLMTSFKALLSSILLAGVALAQTDGPYSLGLAPVGIEKGILNTTLSCNVTAIGFLNLGAQTIGFGVAANLPGRASINQPFYVTAGTRLIVPQSLSGLAGLFGAKFYAGTVDSVTLNTAGATVASVEAAKGVAIPTAALNTNGVSILEVPGNGNSLKVGPIKASKAGSVVLSFGAINATITTLDAQQKATFITAKVFCPAQKRPTSLAAIAVGGKASTATITPAGVGQVPVIPADKTAGVTGFNYNCDFSGFVQGVVRVSLGGVKPTNAQVASGGKIVLSQGQGNIILSQKLVDNIKAIVSIADHTTLTLTTFNIAAQNASPSIQNIIPSGGITVNNVPVQGGAVATIPPTAPQTTLPDVVFTAGASGSTALLSIADAAGNASLRDSDDNEILAIDFTCAALSPNVPVFPYNIQ
ncbi:unnamed protein product [Tilletia controversa]|uniref:Uncharacterized protein n=3 Tax=Tilletia TaxID=13289 RepID=A0A8X7SXY0_9BASI|nr:hypothetical protein CF335_g6881 [Tilletia laevis]KAE8201234.1 hypothetical protein CF328_g2734 [Tilletia controversa]KAE8248102.1 hypothetical protein A4X03_0g6872 [Tilletia caries]KAE8196146.1 hypothetical protein CF336_g2757 [Tilletia laevis]KAE8248931.1 hypothetical protein A4X06_0g3457 [Tilletia controversa]